MQDLPTSDAKPHVENVLGEIQELVAHLRRDGQRIDDPLARALFETSAEVLVGLERAFEHFQSRSEPSWRP